MKHTHTHTMEETSDEGRQRTQQTPGRRPIAAPARDRDDGVSEWKRKAAIQRGLVLYSHYHTI